MKLTNLSKVNLDKYDYFIFDIWHFNLNFSNVVSRASTGSSSLLLSTFHSGLETTSQDIRSFIIVSFCDINIIEFNLLCFFGNVGIVVQMKKQIIIWMKLYHKTNWLIIYILDYTSFNAYQTLCLCLFVTRKFTY